MASETPAPDLTRLAAACRRTLEGLHVVAYFAPEPGAAYKALGLRGWQGYFASRSAPMGAVPAEVTVATFYVFAPAVVGRAVPACWDIVSPEQVLDARHQGMREVLSRVFGHLSPDEMTEAAALAREATTALDAGGRALYAGHSRLPWPTDSPLLALWHAASLLREHRGDGHIAALLVAGLDPVEALISYGQIAGTTDFLKTTRGWTEQEWAAGTASLQDKGVLDGDGAITDSGRALRAEIEARTDATSAVGWEHLGLERCARLRELLRPVGTALRDSDVFPAGLVSKG